MDIWLGLTSMLYVDVHPEAVQKPTKTEPRFDWEGVLYHGEVNGIAPHKSVSDVILNAK